MRFLSILALAAPLVASIQFTSVTEGEEFERGAAVDLQWSSVDTDPTSFSIYLVNFVDYPPFYTYMTSVQTSAGSVSVTIPCDVASGSGWQFNAIAGNNVYVIYAQTPKFNIDDNTCAAGGPTIGSNPEGCPTATTSIVTTTVTTTATVTVSRSRTSTTTTTTSTTASTTSTTTKTGSTTGTATATTTTTTSASGPTTTTTGTVLGTGTTTTTTTTSNGSTSTPTGTTSSNGTVTTTKSLSPTTTTSTSTTTSTGPTPAKCRPLKEL